MVVAVARAAHGPGGGIVASPVTPAAGTTSRTVATSAATMHIDQRMNMGNVSAFSAPA
jgi:hypothetical protein